MRYWAANSDVEYVKLKSARLLRDSGKALPVSTRCAAIPLFFSQDRNRLH
jgi:hypothetical protein